MRSLLQKSPLSRRAIIAISILLFVVFGIITTSRAQAEATIPANGERLITIHDGGQDRGILTKATTLREAFKNANIPIDPNDLIEPNLDDLLIASNYEVNVYRARPVTIVDGAIRTKVMSAYQTAKQITEHAGITLQDEDTTSFDASADMVADGAGVQLSIARATPVVLDLYGTKTTIYTQAKTVAEMLKQKNISLGKDDTLSIVQTAAITPGMTVELWRNGKQMATVEQDIPFGVDKIQDADHEVGYKEVKEAGEKGKRTVTFEIEMKNGQELSRKEIQSVVTKEPKKQVEVVGAKFSLPPGSHQDWMALAGIASSDYGFVEYIVTHEGGWCPVRWQGDSGCVNHGSAPSGRGYGIVQATPGSKMASAGDDWLTNPITQLRWATGYAVGRYGSWQGAYSHWLAVHSW